ncbi:MAG TPA: hypothetical protein VH601_09125 [Bryobacteraceae bacterium]|jgi:hypothetical protein
MLSKVKLLTLTAASLTAVSLVAGTFVLEIGRPSANPEAQAKHAVLVVRSAACAHPEKTNITGNAEGVVNGKRRTIPLTLVPLSGAGSFAVTRQWPTEGKWVLTLVAANSDYEWHPSAIVSVTGSSADFAQVKRANQAPTVEEIEAALNATALAAKVQ